MEGDIVPFYDFMYRDLLLYASSCLPGQMTLMAEDCVQNAVEKAYRERARFESSGQWKAFLLTCIRNQAISIHRSGSAAGNYTEFVRNSSEMHEDMLLDYIRQETLRSLYTAIDALPPDMRELLDLSFEKGLKNSEIAERLGVAEITVKKRKARLLLLLRHSLPDTAFLIIIYSNFLSR